MPGGWLAATCRGNSGNRPVIYAITIDAFEMRNAWTIFRGRMREDETSATRIARYVKGAGHISWIFLVDKKRSNCIEWGIDYKMACPTGFMPACQ